jgi:hypothetical protein
LNFEYTLILPAFKIAFTRPESEKVTIVLKLSCEGILSVALISILGGSILSFEQPWINKKMTDSEMIIEYIFSNFI